MMRRGRPVYVCRYCGIEDSDDEILEEGSHHRRGCPRRVKETLECKCCHVTGTHQFIMENGHHHKILQGCGEPICERGICCPRAEGTRFKCGKIGCIVELVVMYGFVYAIDPNPDIIIQFADRGPNHSIRHDHYIMIFCAT